MYGRVLFVTASVVSCRVPLTAGSLPFAVCVTLHCCPHTPSVIWQATPSIARHFSDSAIGYAPDHPSEWVLAEVCFLVKLCNLSYRR